MNKIVEDYIILDKIGQGQYGDVFRAQHKITKQYFAIKAMNLQKFKQTPKLGEFTTNEITILSKINHPNIIRYYEILRTANNYYLVYELCNGGTLSEYIKSRKRLPEEQALKFFLQLRTAFQVLSVSNILHRDLKPTNILFHNGIVKVADFGFCKELLKEKDLTETMVGSPIYMAPQVLKGIAYDSRADIWSLGVILYEMLYGFCPYEQKTIPKLVGLIDNTMLSFPNEVPVSDTTKTLIKKMLTLNCNARITPKQFFNYSIIIPNKFPSAPLAVITSSSCTPPPIQVKKTSIDSKTVARFVRKGYYYLAQTLQILSDQIDDCDYLRLCFLSYKILKAFQHDTSKITAYWQILGISINLEKWAKVVSSQMEALKGVGDLLRKTLQTVDTSLKTRLQLQTHYIDSKFYMQCLLTLSNQQLQLRLLNCFIYHMHLLMVIEKKSYNFVDHVSDGKSLEEKKELCAQFAKYN